MLDLLIGVLLQYWIFVTFFKKRSALMEFMCFNSMCWIPSFYLLSYLLTLWRVLLEKLTGFQLVKKFPAIYGTRKFITAFTSARQLSLSCASLIQSIPAQFTSCSVNVPYDEILIGKTGFFSSRQDNIYWVWNNYMKITTYFYKYVIFRYYLFPNRRKTEYVRLHFLCL